MSDPREVFKGAKVMLFAGPDLVVLRRDHTPGIAWPGYLDFPGGGREQGETPEACALRETEEELGVRLAPSDLTLVHVRNVGSEVSFFYAAHLPAALLSQVRFGGEGEGWTSMAPDAFAESEDSIPHFRTILADYLSSLPGQVQDRPGRKRL